MDRTHSLWIVILLAGILFVLLVGREAAISVLIGVSLFVLIIGAIVVVIRSFRPVRSGAAIYPACGRRGADVRPDCQSAEAYA
jgi:hypothetical protein